MTATHGGGRGVEVEGGCGDDVTLTVRPRQPGATPTERQNYILVLLDIGMFSVSVLVFNTLFFSFENKVL